MNKRLEELGFRIHSVINLAHEEYTEAIFLRVQDPDGLPFVVYLDSRGRVETRGITVYTCKVSETPCVEGSILRAHYRPSTFSCFGVVSFRARGFTACLKDKKQYPRTFHYMYKDCEHTDEEDVMPVVSYPVIPLSFICSKTEMVSQCLVEAISGIRADQEQRYDQMFKSGYKRVCEFGPASKQMYFNLKNRLVELRTRLKLKRAERDAYLNQDDVCDCCQRTCKPCGYLAKIDREIAEMEIHVQEMFSLWSCMALVFQEYEMFAEKYARFYQLAIHMMDGEM